MNENGGEIRHFILEIADICSFFYFYDLILLDIYIHRETENRVLALLNGKISHAWLLLGFRGLRDRRERETERFKAARKRGFQYDEFCCLGFWLLAFGF